MVVLLSAFWGASKKRLRGEALPRLGARASRACGSSRTRFLVLGRIPDAHQDAQNSSELRVVCV
eukprot:11757870-Prorocentrum_lima.AAC.1